MVGGFNMIKVIKTLRARRMIRLLPERYDLNRSLVVGKLVYFTYLRDVSNMGLKSIYYTVGPYQL